MSPKLRKVSRREFGQLLGTAGIAVAAGTALTLVGERRRRDGASGAAAGTPVRNPAFQPVPGREAGHVLLYCQGPDGASLAYDLNPSGFRIWQECASGEEIAVGRPGKTIAGVASGADVSAGETAEFVSRMLEVGLVYLADSGTRVYYEREEPS